MKTNQLFERLWEHGRTLRRVGLVLVMCLMAISQMWGYNTIYLRSDPWTGGWSYVSDGWTYGGDGQKYWDVYHPGGDAFWRIKIGYYEKDYGPNSDNYVLNVGTSGYQVNEKNTSRCFKTTANAGIIRVCSNQKTGSDEYPYVWVERPGVIFKHPWDGTNWTETSEGDVTDNNDGTYTYKGTYGGTAYFNAKSVNGLFKVAKTTTTVTGSPATGDRCEFKWTPSGYKLTGDEETNRGVFVITKLCKIQYDGNGKTGGSVPSDQEDILYNTATTVRGNDGSLVKTNYIFTGWNANNTGTGAHYAAGSGSISPTATTTTLYAEWEDVWNLKGSWDSWTNYKGMSNVSSNTFQVTLSLAASTTYDFKVVKRVDTNSGNDTYYGKASTTFTRSSLTSAKNLVTTGGDTYNMHITTDVAGDYVFTFVYDASASNMKVLVQYPCATANQVLYKFEVKSTKTSGNVCSAASTLTDLTSEVELSSLAGGTLKANANTVNKLTFVSGGAIQWGESSTSTYLRIDLDCPLQTNDLIRFTNTASKAGNNVYVRHTSNTTETNQFTLDGLSTDAIVEIPDAFNGKSTLWLVRGANNSAQIKYVEILRPYVVTLNAHDGTCSASKIKTMAGNVVLPHAFKDGYRFNGWYTDASGGTKKDDYYTVNSTITLHAQYTSGCPTSGKVFSLAMESSRKTGSTVYPPKAGTMDLIPYATMTYGAAFAGNTHSSSDYGGVTSAGVVQLNNANAYIKIDLDCALDEGDTIYVVSTTSSSNQYYLTAGSTRASTYTTSGTSTKTHSYIVTGSEGFSKTLYIWEGSSSVVVSDVSIKRPAHYTITHDLSHVTTSSPEEVIHKAGYTATYTADDGYELPATISVTRGVTDITTNCTWSAGTVTIPAADCIGDITISVTGEEVSCSATTPGAISKGSASGGTGTITLTAAGSAATNNTWYWQSAADGTATNLGSGATKDVSATGTYYLRSYCSDNGGCWSDAVSVTVAAADLLTTPTATFSNSYYIIGGSSLDLSSLWTSDSEGSVTYSVPSAGGTGASISTAAFTATTAGTATVRASQAANGNYSAITKDATITVLPGYATSIDFEGIIDASGTSAAWKTTMEGQNYKLTQSDGSKWTLDDGTSGTKQADKGLKIKEKGDNAGKIAFAVHANQTVELKVGTLAGTGNGKASFSINGGASYSDITGASTASTGDPVTYTYKGNADRVYVFKTKSSDWNILQHITIGYKVTYDKGSNGTGTVDPMYKTHGTGLTLSSSTFSRDDYVQDGWSTIDGGDKVYDLGGSYTSNAEITLYPHWTVACTDPGLAYATGSVTKTLCDGSFTNTLTNSHSVAVSYASSNTSVAEVASDGTITLVGAGETTITASSIAQTVSAVDYCADEASYTLTVSASTAAGLAYGTSTVKKDVGDDAFTNTLTNSNSLEVTYESSNEDVATIDSDGEVTIKAAGTTTITANSAQQKISSTCYAAGSATYSLTVYNVYTVTYDATDGTCGTLSAKTVTGEVTLPTPTHASYSFDGWYTTAGVKAGNAGAKYSPSGNITLYAKWSGSCAGGGSGTTYRIPVKSSVDDQGSSATPRYLWVTEDIGWITWGSGTATISSSSASYSDFSYQTGSGKNTILIYSEIASVKKIRLYCYGSNAFSCNGISTGTTYGSYSALTVSTDYTFNGNSISSSANGVIEIIFSTALAANTYVQFTFSANGKFYGVELETSGSTCHTVTYHGNGATSGYVNDPVQHTAGSDVTVKYNDPTTGFKRTGYEFNGWNTKADASGTRYDYWDVDHRTIEDIAADVDLYAEWRIVINADNTDFAGKDSPTQYKDVKVTNGATLTITNATTIRDIIVTDDATLKLRKNTTAHDVTVETGSTLNINTTNGDGTGDGITLTANSLSLQGGFNELKSKYDMPRVYINPKCTLTRTEPVINFDISVNHRNYYPIALPFDVELDDVDYALSSLASISIYGMHYEIDKYNGQKRANSGGGAGNWEKVTSGETLKAGKGYIMSAITDGGKAIIRFPMNVPNGWTTAGEQGTYDAVTKNEVAVYAYTKAEGETKKANKGWNLLGVPYMSCFVSSEMDADPSDAYIKGLLNIWSGEYKDGDNNIYVTIPKYDFTEYDQLNITEAVLLPGWCFFVQMDEDATITFDKAGERARAPFRATNSNQAKPTVKTGIILSGAEASDKTTILVSDKYNAAEYEINADLEKMFGENGYTLATYSLSGETRLAYNAMSNADAENIIPIGYRAPAEGEYTFSINPRYAENGAFESVNLIDYETGIVTNLLMSSYTFSTDRTQNDARFALNVVKQKETPTGIENGAKGANDANGVRKLLLDGKMYIILDGKMFDAQGKRVK